MNSLSVVIPAYNEESTVKGALREVFLVARQLGIEYEIIFVNDGSKDRTGEIVRKMTNEIPNLHVVEHWPNRGYGGALKAGFAVATKDLIALYPADRQFRFDEIHLLLEHAKEADIVCGYRLNRRDALIRRINAFGWNLLVRGSFGYLSRDVDCGFKLFHRWVLNMVRLDSDGAMIDAELLASARASGLRIAEVSVTHLPRRSGAATGANLSVIFKACRDLIRFRIHLMRDSIHHQESGLLLLPHPVKQAQTIRNSNQDKTAQRY